MYTIV